MKNKFLPLIRINTIPKSTAYTIVIFSMLSCKQESRRTIHEDSFQANAQITQKIDSIGNHFEDEGKVLGFSIAVLKHGDTLYNKAFGFVDSARTKPATVKTIYKIASITKPHVATVVLKLAEENKLSLDDTLYQWLPDYPNEAHAKKISLRNLINHTSGIPDYITEIDSIFLTTGIPPTKSTYYEFVKDKPLLFEPNSGFSYSNTAFVLMTMIIEKATGNSLENEIDRVITRPMGFTSLKHMAENLNNPNYSKSFELRDSLIALSPMNSFTWIRGDGGWTSSAIELAHFPFGLSNGILLKKASLAQMTAPVVLENGNTINYGLGLRMGKFDGQPVWGHTGGDASTWGMLQLFPEKKLSIAVLVNTNRTSHDALEIWGNVAMAVLNIEPPELENKVLTEEFKNKILGNYQTPTYPPTKIVTIYNPENSLNLYVKTKNNTSNGEKLYYISDNTFASESYPMDRIVFHSSDKGEILGYSFYANGSFRMFRSKLD